MSTIKTQIQNIRVNGFVTPIGVNTSTPLFSFFIEAKNNGSHLQHYRIVVSDSIFKSTVWDSGEVDSPITANIKYNGAPLKDNTAYTVTITAVVSGETVSETSHFCTGYIEKPVVISPKIFAASHISSPLLRHTFFTGAVISHATLYVSGNCLFRTYINGVPTTNNFIIGTKGIAKAIDVTDLLTSDNNTLGVWLMRDTADYKGEQPYIRCGLHFCSVDGESITLDLSSDWFFKESPIHISDLGEVYDNRVVIDKWCDSYSSLKDWQICSIEQGDEVALTQSRNCLPLKVCKSRRTETIQDDLTVYDFGAIVAGRLKIKIMGEPGAKLIIKYAKTESELENECYQDVYVISGHKIEIYEPLFSVHIFRYAELYIDGVAQLISTEAVALGTEAAYPTSLFCGCISSYENYVNVMKQKADYSIIPNQYRTLEGMLLGANITLLESHFLGLEQLGIKSLSNELLQEAFYSISKIDIDVNARKIFINTSLQNGESELWFEHNSPYGKIGVYLRKIASNVHTDFVVPLGFTAIATLKDGNQTALPSGKYLSEEI